MLRNTIGMGGYILGNCNNEKNQNLAMLHICRVLLFKWIFKIDSISMTFDEIILVVHVNIHAKTVLVMGQFMSLSVLSDYTWYFKERLPY